MSSLQIDDMILMEWQLPNKNYGIESEFYLEPNVYWNKNWTGCHYSIPFTKHPLNAAQDNF